LALRRGKLVVLLAIMLPTLCGFIGLVVDGGLLIASARQAQHAADSAATAAAIEIQHGKSNTEALVVAEHTVRQYNLLGGASIVLNCPPLNGPYAGSPSHVQIHVADVVSTYFIHLIGASEVNGIAARAIAGFEPSTADAAILVLDPSPPPFAMAPMPPMLPALPAIVGGLEVLGVGNVDVEGAVLVNNEWGGLDENGEEIGEPAGPGGMAHAVSATPLVGISKLRASDIRVVGGVDDPNNYGPLVSGDPSPLKTGRLPVADPFKDLPVPTIAVDSSNVSDTTYGSRTIIGLPLVGPPTVLRPGVYDSIEVVSGRVTFEPGIYIVRRTNPLTQMAVKILAGEVTADGVMFYITDSPDYTPASGLPDSADGESAPAPSSSSLLPVAAINVGLLGSRFVGLKDAASPFNGMLIYQRRHDRRPIAIVQENLLGPGSFQGTVYSKWGHVVLAGRGSADARFVVGTMRIVALLDLEIRPTSLLPPAQDVYLVE
jgi:hypothetical protein